MSNNLLTALRDEFGVNEVGAKTIARAVLTAMREPDDAMLNAARDWSIKKNGQGVGNDQATGCWQAMTDELLRTCEMSE